MRLYKAKIILVASILVVGFLGTPATAGTSEFQIFTEKMGDNRFDNLSTKIRPSAQPYTFWECRDSQVPGIFLYTEVNKSSKNQRIVATGALSNSPGCPTNLPVRYDFKFTFDKKFIEQLIVDRGCIDSCTLNSGFVGFLESPGRNGWLPYVLTLSYEATYSELNPLPQSFEYDNQIKSKSFSSGDVSSISVDHDVTSGDVQIDIKFRRAPTKKVFSVSYGSGYNTEKNGQDVVCSGGNGAKFANFPKLKTAEDSDLTPTSVGYSKNVLSVNFSGNDLKAETYRENNFKDFPTCFGITYWITKSSYSEGNNCSGSINSGFVNLNCSPYAGWSSWKVTGSSTKVTFPALNLSSVT